MTQIATGKGHLELSERTVRFIYKCRPCKVVKAIDRRYELSYWVDAAGKRGSVSDRLLSAHIDPRCACGRYYRVQQVKAALSEHQCDARCINATGPDCECGCGGKNHGNAYL